MRLLASYIFRKLFKKKHASLMIGRCLELYVSYVHSSGVMMMMMMMMIMITRTIRIPKKEKELNVSKRIVNDIKR